MRRRRHDETPISLFSFQDIITSVTGILILMTLLLTLDLVTRDFKTLTVQTTAVVSDAAQAMEQAQQEVAELRSRLASSTEQLASIVDMAPTRVKREHHDLQQQVNSLTTHIAELDQKVSLTNACQREWMNRMANLNEMKQRLGELERQRDRLVAEREKLVRNDRLIYNPQKLPGKTAWLVDVGVTQILAARVRAKERPQKFPNANAFVRWAKSRNSQVDYFVLLVRSEGIENYKSIFVSLRECGYDMGVDLIGRQQTVIDSELGAGDAE